MSHSSVQIIPLPGLPEIAPRDDLSRLIAEAANRQDLRVVEGDLFVVAQKIVSKAEGKIVRLDSIQPSKRAQEWAAEYQKDARVIELVVGILSWTGVRILVATSVFALVVAVAGAFGSPLAALTPLAALLCGLAFAAVLMAISAATGQGMDELRTAVIEMLSADFANTEVDVPAANGRVLAYLSAHAEIYRQEFHDNRVMVRCFLPRYLLRHIQEPDVRIRSLDNGEKKAPEEERTEAVENDLD